MNRFVFQVLVFWFVCLFFKYKCAHNIFVMVLVYSDIRKYISTEQNIYNEKMSLKIIIICTDQTMTAVSASQFNDAVLYMSQIQKRTTQNNTGTVA